MSVNNIAYIYIYVRVYTCILPNILLKECDDSFVTTRLNDRSLLKPTNIITRQLAAGQGWTSRGWRSLLTTLTSRIGDLRGGSVRRVSPPESSARISSVPQNRQNRWSIATERRACRHCGSSTVHAVHAASSRSFWSQSGAGTVGKGERKVGENIRRIIRKCSSYVTAYADTGDRM